MNDSDNPKIVPESYDRAAVITGFRRAAVITGLRELAEFLERNPDVPTPQSVQAQRSCLHEDEHERVTEVHRVAEMINRNVRERPGESVSAVRRFGAVEYRVYANLRPLVSFEEAAASNLSATVTGPVSTT